MRELTGETRAGFEEFFNETTVFIRADSVPIPGAAARWEIFGLRFCNQAIS